MLPINRRERERKREKHKNEKKEKQNFGFRIGVFGQKAHSLEKKKKGPEELEKGKLKRLPRTTCTTLGGIKRYYSKQRAHNSFLFFSCGTGVSEQANKGNRRRTENILAYTVSLHFCKTLNHR